MIQAAVGDDDGYRHDWAAHHALRAPDRAALVDLDSRRAVSWAELDRRVDTWRARFAAAGARRGDRIAVLAANCPEMLEVQLACARAGLLFVPLNWRLAQAELEYIVGNAQPALIVTDAAHAAPGRLLAQALGVPSSGIDDDAPAGDPPPAEPVPLGAPAALVYTSGTTGRPKGAVITHRTIFWHAVNITPEARISPRSVHLAVLPFFHTGGLNLYVNPVLHAGGTVVVARRVDPGQILAALQDPDLGITHLFGVPTVYQSLADHPDFARASLSHLAMTGVGGAACPLPLLATWSAIGRPLAQGWGMTEAGPSGTVCDPDAAAAPPGSVGQSLLHFSIRVVDADGADLPDGSVGELWVRGPSVTPGYWRDEAATADAFRDGWFRTGDAGYRDKAGYFFIVDRWKDMYISGGENVYPAEVEAVLAQLDGVQASAVVGVPDDRWGEAGRAYLVLKPGAAVTTADVVAHCAARLAKFKVPKQVVVVDELPMTGSGKVMKRALKDRG